MVETAQHKANQNLSVFLPLMHLQKSDFFCKGFIDFRDLAIIPAYAYQLMNQQAGY